MDARFASTSQPQRLYRLFGLTLASNFAFANRLVDGAGTPDLIFTCSPQPPFHARWQELSPLFSSHQRDKNGKLTLTILRQADCHILHFSQPPDFYLWEDRIHCHIPPHTPLHLVEIRLLGMVMAFWLELQNNPVLHASAVTFKNTAIAFLSSNQGGKSSLAAALMQAGCPLLTDDLLTLRNQGAALLALPGYPTMRLWQDEAQFFLGDTQALERVHPRLDKLRVPVGSNGFGAFCDQPQPLSCIYLPMRRSPSDPQPEVEIVALSPKETVFKLLQFQFIPHLVSAFGWLPARLEFFARLAQQVPMRRLIYPSGLASLDAVRQALLRA